MLLLLFASQTAEPIIRLLPAEREGVFAPLATAAGSFGRGNTAAGKYQRTIAFSINIDAEEI